MKKNFVKILLLTGVILLTSFIKTFAQYSDPAVNSPAIYPAPGLVGGLATISFNFTNVPNAISAGSEVGLSVGLNEMAFELDANGNPLVSGTGAEYFNWRIDPTHSFMLFGEQKPGVAIPGMLNSTISVIARYTVASPESEMGTKEGNGYIVNVQQGAADNNLNNDFITIYTYTNGFLPVVFGDVNAVFSGTDLSINWKSESEIKSDRFLVQLSKDGTRFITVDSLNSIAVDGNSEKALTYSYKINGLLVAKKLGSMAGAFAALIVVLIAVSFVLKGMGRRLVAGFLAFIFLTGIVFVSCRKKITRLQILLI